MSWSVSYHPVAIIINSTPNGPDNGRLQSL